MSRDSCLATLLDELHAFDQFTAAPPSGNPPLPPLTIAALLVGTLGVISLLAWPGMTRTRRRTQYAIDADLPRLESMGFQPANGTSPPTPSGMRPIKSVRQALVRGGATPVWLIEGEQLALVINSLWPTRCAIVATGRPLPKGSLVPKVPGAAVGPPDYVSTFDASPAGDVFVRMVRGILDPYYPRAIVEAHGGVVRVWSVHTAKPVSKGASAPIALASLADIAIALADAVRREADGSTLEP